jgi:glycosyltransferase involved in cell wall biosynthesis
MLSQNHTPALSFVVVFFNMAREAPRTLFTLSPAYQRGVSADDYEVIAVDAGSDESLAEELVRGFGGNFRLVRTAASASPVAAVNHAASLARGGAIALCIDGARMLSPGILRHMLAAFRAWDDPLVATLAWHLGPKVQNESLLEGYNQAAEDALLDSVDWQRDGYELFRIATLASSSTDGWFLPIAESNCLAVRKESWNRLGGLHQGFTTPGGGLVNLDFYRNAVEALDSLVVLLGEGTFHQFHGGVATNVPLEKHPFAFFSEEYARLRGKEFRRPEKPPLFLGGMPPQALDFLRISAIATNNR